MAFDRLGDIVMHHATDGPRDAPLLVMVNSLGTDLRVWDALLPWLSNRFQIIRYDKRGHGLSDATPGPHTMNQLADDLARRLGLYRNARASVEAHSSKTVAQMATPRPDP